MFSTLRMKFGIPGVISVIALVFAMFGGAYAASNSSGGGKATASAKAKKGPKGPKGATGPAGPAGPVGPAGPAGAKGDNGAAGTNGTNGALGAAGQSVKSEIEPPGANCSKGGSKFVAASGTTYACNGANGTPGQQGPEGEPWTAGGTLPSGATETGVWGTYINAPAGTQAFPISLGLPLATAPEVIFLQEGELSKPGSCPGQVGGIPTAEPGKLCVYANVFENATSEGFWKTTPPASEGGFGVEEPGTNNTGTLFKVKCAPLCFAAGTWAVTGE